MFEGTRKPRALFVGSYVPRECGIATFTEDLKAAYDLHGGDRSPVIAVTDPGRTYDYPDDVIAQIHRDEVHSYVAAARVANESDVDVVNVQHEYGLFGGERGSMLLDFLAMLRKPVVLTMHTTLPEPDTTMRYVTRELCNRSDEVVVLAKAGKEILTRDYGIDHRKVRVVLHGAPDVMLRRSTHFKKHFGLTGRTVISTFGLLSRGKGIEYVLDALPAVFEKHPNAAYVLFGQTHPEIKRREGEAYREELWRRAQSLGIADRVQFVNRYMSDDDVVKSLLATDVYVSPSLDPHQIVSGTLSYAVACGRVVIATPYLYARELLAGGRGVIVPFRDSDALEGSIDAVLSDPALRSRLETRAYRFGRKMTWRRVAAEYASSFRGAAAKPRPQPIPMLAPLRPTARSGETSAAL